MRKARTVATHGVDWRQTYSVSVTDNSASPRYFPGDTLHVHPGLPVEAGNWVLVIRRGQPGKASPASEIAKLIARDNKVVILQQLNPMAVYRLDAGAILTINRIVGSSEAGT